MKDFYGIWFLAQTFTFEARALGSVLRATFQRRRTRLDRGGLNILLDDLSGDLAKRTQWRAFLRKSSLAAPDDFALVNDAIRAFVLPLAGTPVIESLAGFSWPPGGPWPLWDSPTLQLGER